MKVQEGLRPELTAVPKSMRHLRTHRGYPVPWFVAWIDGVPEFRVADGKKFRFALRDKMCWVCGRKLGPAMTFLIGPMCGINRTTAEPPCHLECARFSVINCPFLSRPDMERREGNYDPVVEREATCAGEMIRRNPGVSLLWTTRGYTTFGDGKGGVLIDVGEHTAVEWWSRGRKATRAEVEESVRTGLPVLERLCEGQAGAIGELRRRQTFLETLYPKE